jgi:C1A family cysteine protease
MNPVPRGFGWLPDVPKIKDFGPKTPEVKDLMERTSHARLLTGVTTTRSGAAAAPALETSVDWRMYCSPIVDQGQLGSCTANAAAGLVEYFERRSFGKFIGASRLFIYKATRDLLGWQGDTGAYLRSAMEALVMFGAPPEQYWPYDIPNFDIEPSAFLYAMGASYQATKYFRLDPNGLPPDMALQNIKTYLAAGFPSMFGFPVYEEYMNVPADGKVAYPKAESHYYGGHANVAVGYDDTMTIGDQKGALLVRNSWGKDWGLEGYAWMSYQYVTEALASDWWSLIDAKWIDTGNF